MQLTTRFVGNARDVRERQLRQRRDDEEDERRRAEARAEENRARGFAIYYGPDHYHDFGSFVHSYRSIGREAVTAANELVDEVRSQWPTMVMEFVGEIALMKLWQRSFPSLELTHLPGDRSQLAYDGYSHGRTRFYEVKMLTSQDQFRMPESEFRHRVMTENRITVLIGFHARDNYIVDVVYGEMKPLVHF